MQRLSVRALGWLSLSFSLVFLATSVVAAYRTHHGVRTEVLPPYVYAQRLRCSS